MVKLYLPIFFQVCTDLHNSKFDAIAAITTFAPGCKRSANLFFRPVPCVIIGTIYHPPNADDSEMLDYLSTTLTIIEGQYPGCGIFLAGVLNCLNVSRLSTQFKMTQLVRSPSRGDRILDLILTNLPQLYDRNSVQIYPRLA